MRTLLIAAIALLPLSVRADNKAFGFDTTPAKATDPAGNLNFTQPVNFPANQFATEGVVRNFGNSANKIPILDGTGKLVVGIIPGLPASIITSGTFPDVRIASAGTWNAKENALTFSSPLSRTGDTISISTTGFEVPLTFSGGVTRASNNVTVDAVQNITRLSNLTANGIVRTSAGNGTLTIDTASYEAPLTFGTGMTRTGNSVALNANQTFSLLTLSGPSNGVLWNEQDSVGTDWIAYATGGIFRLYNGSDRFRLGATGIITLATWQGVAIADTYIASAGTWNGKENALTFSTGLTRTTNTITVNSSQSIGQLTNLTSNGFVKTSAANGTLVIDTATYLTANQTITLSGDVSGSGATTITATLATVNSNVGTFGDLTHVPQFTVNGKGLITAASQILLTPTSVQLGSVTNDAQTKAAIVPNTAPAAGQILIGNAGGTAYAPATVSGSGATITASSAGVFTISAIPNATLSNSSITIAGTGTALGGSITLDTITGVSSNGIIARTAANTRAVRTITGTANQITVTNGDGVSGNPTLSVPALAQLSIANITNLTGNGFVKTSGGTGALSIDANAYLTGNQTITLSGDASGSGATAITVSVTRINGTALSGLATGILKNTTTTGVPSIAVAADFPTLNQSTTGSAATLTTARNIGAASFNGSAAITLDAITGLSSNGMMSHTAANTFTARTLSGTTNQVTVTNGDGVSGNPTFSIPASAQLSIAKITNLTTNGFVRTASSDGTLSASGLVAGDIPGTLNATSFSGNISAAVITGASSGSGDAFQVGNDTMLVDINVADGFGVQSIWDRTRGMIKLGSGGPTLLGTASGLTITGNTTVSGTLTTGTFFPADYDIGIAASYSPNVVMEGDSLLQQLGGINSYFGTGSVPALTTVNGLSVSPATGQNVAVAGYTIQNMRDNPGRLQTVYRREAGINIAIVLAGTNTLTTKTVAETYSELEAYCKHLRNTGWRVVLVGLLSRGGSNGNGTYDSQVGAVNAFLRQNWAQLADRFIDWGVINGGSNEFNTGGYSNSTYYTTSDQLHQQVAGAQKLAGYIAPVVNDLLVYYFQSQRNQLYVHVNKSTHSNAYNTGMFTLNNENPSAGQDEINFAFNKVVKENIRGDFNGSLTIGATGYVAVTVHPSGPDGTDIYTASGGTDTGERFYVYNTRIESTRPFRVSSNSATSGFTGSGLDLNYSASLDYGIITSFNYSTPAWKPLLLQASTVKISASGTDVGMWTINGLGVGTLSPVAPDGSAKTFQIGDRFVFQNTVGNQATIARNAYYDGSNWKAAVTGSVNMIRIYDDPGYSAMSFFSVPSRTAGTNINADLSYTVASMEVTSSGVNLPAGKNYYASGASVLVVGDNVNTQVNAVTGSGAIYLNWSRGASGLGVIFGGGAANTVGRFSAAGGLTVGNTSDAGAGNVFAYNKVWAYNSTGATRNALQIGHDYTGYIWQSANDLVIDGNGDTDYRIDIAGTNNGTGAIAFYTAMNTTRSRYVARFQGNGALKLGDGAPNQWGDIGIARSGGTTGVLYLGGSSNGAGDRYLYFDGTQYALPGASLVVNGTTYTSSQTVKKNIRDWKPDATKPRLRPRKFERIETPGVEEIGFVAEEVEQSLPEAFRPGAADANDPTRPRPPGIDPMAIIAKLAADLQTLQDRIEELEKNKK